MVSEVIVLITDHEDIKTCEDLRIAVKSEQALHLNRKIILSLSLMNPIPCNDNYFFKILSNTYAHAFLKDTFLKVIKQSN